mgnify:CR=1 FL=1
MAEQFKKFDLFDDDIPLKGRCLIEASAGTGKTYNITGLVVRFVAENILGAGDDISNILVVTYTKAATQELKERIVERLRRCYEVLQTHQPGKNVFLQEFLERYRKNQETKNYLHNAIRQIDELSVFTIHGFAQRLLQQYAPQAGFNFNGEIITDSDELTLELITDYWRQTVAQSDRSIKDRALLMMLRGISSTPKKFNDKYGSFITDPAITFSRDIDFSKWEEQIHTTQNVLKAVQQNLNPAIIKDFRKLYSGDYDLNAGEFKSTNWPDIETALSHLQEAEFFFEIDDDQLKNLDYLGYERIAEKFNKNFTYEKLPVSESTTGWMKSFGDLLDGIENFNDSKSEVLETVLAILKDRYENELNEREAFTYDDLLKVADRMIHDHPAIRQEVRDSYPISLIDEFQDTDPLQWSLFDKLYEREEPHDSAGLLYLIGDPKQSIYKFRGADINAYLNARNSINPENCYTLRTNYRSDEGFVTALNKLWGRHENPFYREGIPYEKAEANHEDRSPLTGSLAPIHWIVDDAGEADLDKNSALERAAEITASHIKKVLHTRNNDEGFEPKDIAVLCRTNKQASLVKEALFRNGLNSVLLNRESIYKSDEAAELHILLKAAVECSNLANIRAALGTRIVAKEGLLLQIQDGSGADDNFQHEWNSWVRRFREYHEEWETSGFTGMMQRLLADCDGYYNLLAYNDGERRVTNINHLIQLLQEHARERPGEMHYLLHKLQMHISDAEKSQSEEEELRLESDRELIKIATIHRSKGLDYNVVYCPFLWDGINASGLKKKLPYTYKSPEDPTKKRIELLGNRYDDSPFRYFEEELADHLRVTYVALTRGVYHNIFIHVPYKTNYKTGGRSSYSAIDYILLGRERYQKALHKKFANYVTADETDWITYGEIQSAIKNLADNSGEQIEYNVWNDTPADETLPEQLNGKEKHYMQLKEFKQRNHLYPAWTLGSYSSLTRNDTELDELTEQATEKMDEEEPQPDAVSESESGNEIKPHPQSMFVFPKGAQTGLCWHTIFELMPFHDTGKWRSVVKEQLATHGFDTDRWLDLLLKKVKITMNLPLSDADHVKLSYLRPEQVRKEMAFHFGFRQADAASLISIIRNGNGIGNATTQVAVEASSMRGFMKGFIDLTFRYKGKIYMLDYKSNHLGNRFDDYKRSALSESISESMYDLQYHIYSLALHRYLKERIGTDYSYEKHFGGVFYLYLRGIQENESTGVFFDRPEASTIEQLNEYFDQFRGYHE